MTDPSQRASEPRPRIIYLDQNKWIELLRAEKSPSASPSQFALLQRLIARAQAHEIVLPLSATNIYETYKIANKERRRSLARLQALLSGGLVFRGRNCRLETELFAVLSATYGLALPPQANWWFLSDVFFEAFAENGDERAGLNASARLIDLIRQHPATALYDHLTTATDEARASAVKMWSDGSEALRSRVERRRQSHQKESFAMRKRIYNVLMFSDEIEVLAQMADKLGIHWNSTDDIGASLARRLVNEMPIYQVEREIAVRLEDQVRPIDENDFRDVQAYCAAIPYADVVVGENQAINLARQARLGVQYDTELETNLDVLAA